MTEQQGIHKNDRGIGVNYVWPHFEKELYSICAQRRCTQIDGKTKNMSENFLMREQFSQNSRKRKDKRLRVENEGSDAMENKGNEIVMKINSQKRTKQNRRVVQETTQVTPSHGIVVTSENNIDHIIAKEKLLEKSSRKVFNTIVGEVSARRQLEYGEATENHLVLNNVINNNNNSNDVNNSKRNLEETAEVIVGQSETDAKRQKTTPDEEPADEFSAGQLIWGKLKGFDWWPGMVVDLKNSSQSLAEAKPNEVWVKWYGDNKFSKLPKTDMASFCHFGAKYMPQKFRGTYKRAVVSSLEVAASRCQKQFTTNGTTDESENHASKEERAKLLVDWALENFQPSGSEAFEIVKEGAEVIVEQSEVDAERQKTTPDDVSSNNECEQKEPADEFSAGQLIWGKLKGFDWWPGMVVEFKNASHPLIEAKPNEVWVKWYGDNKVSKLPNNDMASFRHFGAKYLHQKFRGTYKRAVVSSLEVAASRCQKQFTGVTTEESENPSKEERAKLLVDWALDNFQPSGPEVFEIIKDEWKAIINTNTVAPEAEWNRREGKERFGQPIRTPALAEDVKDMFEKAKSGIISIDDICLGCGDNKISVPHPLFHGSLCKECKETFLECSYLFDQDGYQMYCTICGDGKEVFMCESSGCFRSYCAVCLELICGSGTVEKISSLDKWCCAMCLDDKVGLLRKRDDWQQQLRDIFASDKEQEYPAPTFSPAILPEKRRPIRVLSLFDGIATGLQTLKELGIEIELYIASEIDEKATQVVRVQHADNDIIKFVGDIEQITREQVQQWGPFDLVIGASPCNDLSIANPARQGIFEGSGRLFFEYFRLLTYAKPAVCGRRPFFWLFENVVSMRAVDKRTISRFLQCNPVVVDAKDISPARRARYFWGNLPGMNRPTAPIPGDNLSLQSCLEPNCGRKARFTKIQTVTTKGNSLKQTKEGILPVEVTTSLGLPSEDILWCTEMERLFGFPPHYTDVGNMGKQQRQKLLGKAWSVPVVRHLLSPLRDYFSSKTSGHLNNTLEDCS